MKKSNFNDKNISGFVHQFDQVIHDKVRLGILSFLAQSGGKSDFKSIKAAFLLTDGNCATHLRVLEEHGIIEVKKSFRGRKPHTSYLMTKAGKEKFVQYLDNLKGLLQQLEKGGLL